MDWFSATLTRPLTGLRSGGLPRREGAGPLSNLKIALRGVSYVFNSAAVDMDSMEVVVDLSAPASC